MNPTWVIPLSAVKAQLHCKNHCGSGMSPLITVTLLWKRSYEKELALSSLQDCCSPLTCKTGFQSEAHRKSSQTRSADAIQLTGPSHSWWLERENLWKLTLLLECISSLETQWSCMKRFLGPQPTIQECWYDTFDCYWAKWWQDTVHQCHVVWFPVASGSEAIVSHSGGPWPKNDICSFIACQLFEVVSI